MKARKRGTDEYSVSNFLKMPQLRKIVEFDLKTQNFESYLERFEHFVTAKDIAEAKRLPVFLTVIGPEAYEVLRSLVVPEAPGQKSYKGVKRPQKFSNSGTVQAQPARTAGGGKCRRVHRGTQTLSEKVQLR